MERIGLPQGPKSHHWYDPIRALLATIITRIANLRLFSPARMALHQKLKNVKDLSGRARAARQFAKLGTQLTDANLNAYFTETKGTDWVDDRLIGGFMSSIGSRALATKTDEDLVEHVRTQLDFLQLPVDGIVYFPVVLRSGAGPIESQHIVLISADQDANTIEYFDSKGMTFTPGGQSKTDQIISTVVTEVRTKLGMEAAELVQNPTRFQRNIHDCGAFVAQRIESQESLEEYITTYRPNISVFRWNAAETLSKAALA